MFCSVQVVRGPSGERRQRRNWDAPIEGQLRIVRADRGLTATLTRRDIDKVLEVLPPIFDVCAVTFEAGLLVVGYAIRADSANNVVREYRQAWYCVPGRRQSG